MEQNSEKGNQATEFTDAKRDEILAKGNPHPFFWMLFVGIGLALLFDAASNKNSDSFWLYLIGTAFFIFLSTKCLKGTSPAEKAAKERVATARIRADFFDQIANINIQSAAVYFNEIFNMHESGFDSCPERRFFLQEIESFQGTDLIEDQQQRLRECFSFSVKDIGRFYIYSVHTPLKDKNDVHPILALSITVNDEQVMYIHYGAEIDRYYPISRTIYIDPNIVRADGKWDAFILSIVRKFLLEKYKNIYLSKEEAD